MTNRKTNELWYALIAIVAITLVYLWVRVIFRATPASSSFFGHTIGVVGFVLMLLTETLYSLRKRSRLAHWGPMASWLQFHIFTGIVGPYMVLLHSSWKFHGVAGILTFMTSVIVLSGFIGRYIYTAVPRTADGLELEEKELERQIKVAETHLEAYISTRHQDLSAYTHQLNVRAATQIGISQVFGRDFQTFGNRFRRWSAYRRMEPELRAEVQQIEALLDRRDTLRRQAQSLQTARRLLATWHTIHIPIGLGVFALAFVHIGAAIYFSGMLP